MVSQASVHFTKRNTKKLVASRPCERLWARTRPPRGSVTEWTTLNLLSRCWCCPNWQSKQLLIRHHKHVACHRHRATMSSIRQQASRRVNGARFEYRPWQNGSQNSQTVHYHGSLDLILARPLTLFYKRKIITLYINS